MEYYLPPFTIKSYAKLNVALKKTAVPMQSHLGRYLQVLAVLHLGIRTSTLDHCEYSPIGAVVWGDHLLVIEFQAIKSQKNQPFVRIGQYTFRRMDPLGSMVPYNFEA